MLTVPTLLYKDTSQALVKLTKSLAQRLKM